MLSDFHKFRFIDFRVIAFWQTKAERSSTCIHITVNLSKTTVFIKLNDNLQTILPLYWKVFLPSCTITSPSSSPVKQALDIGGTWPLSGMLLQICCISIFGVSIIVNFPTHSILFGIPKMYQALKTETPSHIAIFSLL